MMTEREWVPSDLALPPDHAMDTDPDGTLTIPVEFGRLLAFLAQHWDIPTSFDGHTLECYLVNVYRAIYFTPTWVAPLVLEELQSDNRSHKPAPEYVQRLCSAAIAMQRAWTTVGFAHTYSPEEPDLTRRGKHRRPKD